MRVKEKLALVLDFETTGLLVHPGAPLSVQPKIIEIGAALINAKGSETESLSTLVRLAKGEKITDEITKITGITNDQLASSGIDLRSGLIHLRDLFRKAHCLIAHNLPFDKTVLEYELVRVLPPVEWYWPEDEYDSAAEFAHEFGYTPRLIHLYEAKVGKPFAQTHRALDDVHALAEALTAAGFFKEVLS